jgi:lactate dehydrogenase-like 2-hydroxyacid dehydrogenase
MTKPVLVVTTRYPTEVEDRIDRDYSARRNPNRFPFSEEELLSAAEGADALFITPADQLDSGFFQKVSPTVKIIATYSVGFEHVDLQIHYYDPSEFPAEIAGDAVYHKDPSDLLRASQFLSHKPSAPRAIVVNTARGGLVVDDDLIAALKSGRVAAAGLDVFEGEPRLHPEYASLKNTFLLPHIGSATIETRTAMGMLALDNVEAVLNGRPAPTHIQP